VSAAATRPTVPAAGRPSRRDVAPIGPGNRWDLLTMPEAVARLGLTYRTILKLGYYGAIKVIDNGPEDYHNRWRVRLAPKDTCLTLYRRWAKRVRRWHFRTTALNKDIRVALKIPDSEPQPPGALEFGAACMARLADFREEEATAFAPVADTRSHNRMREIARRAPLRGSGPPPGTPEMVAERFPMLAGLPNTCLADAEAEEFAAPDPGTLGVALAMGPAAGTACWFAIQGAAAYRLHNQGPYVRAIRELDAELQRLGADGVTETRQVEAALGAILEAGEAGDRPAARAENLMRILTLARFLRRAARAQDPDGSRRLASLAPSIGPTGNALVARIHRFRRGVVLTGRARRKAMSDPIADNLPRLVRTARFRSEMALATAEDLAEGAAALQARAEALAKLPRDLPWGTRHRMADQMPYEEVVVTTTVMTPDGLLVRGAAQECVWWVWRECDLWESLAPGAMRRLRGKGRRRGSGGIRERAHMDLQVEGKIAKARREPEAYQRIFYEFRGVRPAPGSGTAAMEPWFVTHARLALFRTPAQLSGRLQRRRHRGLILLRMPTRPGRLPGGLIGWDKNGGALAGWLLERNRVVVPMDNVLGGTLLADLATDAVFETLCRGHELLQASQHPDHWKLDGLTGTGTMGWMAILKVPPNEPIPAPVRLQVSDGLFEQFMDTAQRIARLCGHGDWLPEIEPADSVGWKSPEPRPVIMQWRGIALETYVVSYLVGILFAGCGRISLHPLRRAGANFLRQLGMAERLVQLLLHHRDPRQTRWYSLETARQALRDAVANIRGVRAAAGRMDGREAAATVRSIRGGRR
jgi:hypothetical protein